MKRGGILLVLGLLLVFSFPPKVFAESTYVLPYPSEMPGGISYKIHRVWEKVMHYWHFGTFGQFEYNLSMSDKYLVEAKTLFEYKQYLLGYNALIKSNQYFEKTLPLLKQARFEHKEVTEKSNLLAEAALKHKEVLEKMRYDVPSEFVWVPEKDDPTVLRLGELIDKALGLSIQYYESCR